VISRDHLAERSQFLVGLLRVSRLFSEVGVDRGDRAERFYPSAEFVSDVGVFMVEREVVGKYRTCSSWSGGPGRGVNRTRIADNPLPF
jgi:hypothetical protein